MDNAICRRSDCVTVRLSVFLATQRFLQFQIPHLRVESCPAIRR